MFILEYLLLKKIGKIFDNKKTASIFLIDFKFNIRANRYFILYYITLYYIKVFVKFNKHNLFINKAWKLIALLIYK